MMRETAAGAFENMEMYETTISVEAQQFMGPTQETRASFVPPDGMKMWPDDFGHQPRDMSWGFVQTKSGKRHIYHADWIVTYPDGTREVFSDREFKMKFTLA